MNYNFPIAFFGPIECYTTNIPGSASLPLQVIADTGLRAAVAIEYHDTTNRIIGIYTGAVGQEVLLCMIGNGYTARAYGVVTHNSRVSVRSMDSDPVTNGQLAGTLVGY